ncbi:hypothetical protein ACWDOP_03425 [Nocardia sp. NPDC003693]
MKTSTSISIDPGVLNDAREAAAAAGETVSTLTERAVRRELLRIAAKAAAEWERSRGTDTAEYAEQLHAEQAANISAAYGAGTAK